MLYDVLYYIKKTNVTTGQKATVPVEELRFVVSGSSSVGIITSRRVIKLLCYCMGFNVN